MRIDHICFAVKNISEGVEYWKDVFGYSQMTEVVENSLQKVKVVFLKKQNSIIVKLIEPLESNVSVKNTILRGEGGFHHICFRCDNMEKEIDFLKSKGLFLLSSPQPGEAFNNNKIAFLLAKGGLNIEVIDTDEKAARLDYQI